MQLTYSQNMTKAIAGTLYDLSPKTVDSYAAETDTISLGMGVVGGTDPETQVKLPSAAVTAIKGIAMLRPKEQAADGTVTYGDTDSLPVLSHGRAWVPVTGAVAADAQAFLVFSGANKGKWAGAAGGTAAGIAAAGTATAYSHNAANTGTITAAPATGAGCKAGTYKVTCIETATDSGTFIVEDPDGITIGRAVVGGEFSTHVTFTIADGVTNFIAGEGFDIVVAAVAAVPIASAITGAKFITSTSGAGLAAVELN